MPLLLALLTLLATSLAPAFELPRQSSQVLLGLADSWDSSHITLTLHQRTPRGWQRVGGPLPARIGKNGLAWGLGLHPLPPKVRLKKEGDLRAPAGVFAIGGAWGYAPDIRRHPRLPYRQITPNDLWVEDPQSPHYNQHLILPHPPRTPWEKKAAMRQNDHAHSLKLFIAHNAPPHARPGYGSAIFFHIWRGGGSKPTAGCTTLREDALQSLIAWIDPNHHPLYILLPRPEYQRLRNPWKLP